jgi:thiamine pyrophosphate-dependent acetolactate synthase large subunit-like protein
MKRHEATEIICQHISEKDLVVSSTGDLSRELFIIADSPQFFYMMGSMGLASSIGLGLAISCPNRRVIVIEGDGSIIMNMGSMATIGHYAPKNLIHIVLDNEVYESTGAQPSVSNTTNLDKVAQDTGYKIVRKIASENELKEMLENNMKFFCTGPMFILIKVEKGGIYERIPRVLHETEEIANYFKKLIERS